MVQPSSHSNEMPSAKAVKLAQRLHQHPHLQAKVEELLAVVENAFMRQQRVQMRRPQRVIEEIQKLGQAALQGSCRAAKSTTNPGITREDCWDTSVA
jgi:hypothetical protein